MCAFCTCQAVLCMPTSQVHERRFLRLKLLQGCHFSHVCARWIGCARCPESATFCIESAAAERS